MSSYTRHRRHTELFKYPNSQVWWFFLTNPKGGRKLRISSGHRDAEAAHLEYLRRVRTPVDTSTTKERDLDTALKTRLNWLKSNRQNEDSTRKKLAEDTIEFYEKKSGTLNRILGSTTLLSAITPERLREYIQARTEEGAAGTTIEKELTTLSMAMKLAKKDGVTCELVRDLKPEDFQTTYVPRERWLSRDEYDRFARWWYAHRLPQRGAVLDFLVATGATYPSEVHRTRRSDINLKTFEVHIRGRKRETRDRTFIVPSDRRSYLERAMKHADGKGDTLFSTWGNVRRDILVACAYLSMCEACEQRRNLWWHHDDTDTWTQGTSQVAGAPGRDPACKACGDLPVFEPFCPTDLRRTFAQWLVQAGVPYELAYPLMGHKDDRMLKLVYGRRKASDVAVLIEAVLSRV